MSVDAALAELKFHHDRLASGSDAVTTIGHNIFFLVAAGVLAATQIREAIVLVPLFWSAWMLHSLQRSRDSIKHQVYARSLETYINEKLGTPVLLWNRVLTTGRLSPLITVANFAYWGILNLTAWVAGVVVLAQRGHGWWAVGLATLGATVYAVAVQVVVTNATFEARCQAAVDQALGQASSWAARYEGDAIARVQALWPRKVT
jgi:hypothetical protein